MTDLCVTDFCAWANPQARLLREGRLAEADLADITEEIESMARGEKRNLAGRLEILLLHLQNCRHQPRGRTASRRVSIISTRDALSQYMKDNPSLKAYHPEAIATAHRRARPTAAAETRLAESSLPVSCPWWFEQAMAADVWPEGNGEAIGGR